MKICFIIQKRFYTFLPQIYKLSAFRKIRQWTCRSLSGIMNPKAEKDQRILMAVFLCLWFVMNLLQSYFTELAHDEAYYWMYSRYPAWGYFDHPPMVAMLIRAGYFLIENEAGVRILFCLLGTLTLLLTYKMSDGTPWLFMLITSAIVLVHTHVAGFLAIPDVPLVFFTALFFFLYKRYLEKDSAGIAAGLAIAITGMFYSKYHGLLVVVFVFLSNLSLVKRKSAWMIVGLVMLAMVPHLMWQIRHGFPTLQYHLVSRSDGFVPDNIWNYLYSQVLVAGPLVAPLVLYFSLSSKPAGLFDRSLRFTLAGFLVFFFLSSFRDHIEAHWTAAAFVPMIIMAHSALSRHKQAAKWLTALALPSILLILFLRTIIAFDMVPDSLKRLDEYNGWKQWAGVIKETAGGKNVAFLNKYQFAAKYTFYAGDFSCSVSDVFARKNQYTLWEFEDSLAGQPVMFYGSPEPDGTLASPINHEFGYCFFENYQPLNRLTMDTTLPSQTVNSGDTIGVCCRISNTASYSILIAQSGKFKPVLSFVICNEDGSFYQPPRSIGKQEAMRLEEKGSATLYFTFVAPDKPGKYSLYTIFQLPAACNMGNPVPAIFNVR